MRRFLALASLSFLLTCSGDRPLLPAASDETPPNHSPKPPLAAPPPGIPRDDAPPQPQNPIPEENGKEGAPGWDDAYDAWNRQIEGYADRVSAAAGETVRFMLRSDRPGTATWTLYRLGWYGGAGAREVARGGPVVVDEQPPCPPAPETGLIRCNWEPTFSLRIEADWLSGLYALKTVRDDDYTRFIPLVIVDHRPADILMQANVTTYQAYNAWGGNSLYVDASGTLPLGRAVQVSFDRPYDGDRGAGQMFRYEAHMARFLESHGYDVTYTTNLDVHARGAAAFRDKGVFLDVGHDEYWSDEQLRAVLQARDDGLPLLFLGANTAYWRIRLEGADAEGRPRVITCYKGRSADDPVQGPLVTGRFRDPEVNQPESALTGVMYESWMLINNPWVVSRADDFLYAGTGLADGDVLPFLVGYEYDRSFADRPPPAGLRIVSRSPVIDAEGRPGHAEAGWYRGKRGNLVFASGTIDWVLGVGASERRDPRIERMTANLLQEAIGAPIPEALQRPNPPPAPSPIGPFAASVDTLVTGLGTPAGLSLRDDGSLLVAAPRRHQILEVAPDGGMRVLAGDGQLSNNPAYDDVPASQARFFGPTAVLADEDGVLVADTYNHVIRKVRNDGQRTVTTLAGKMGAQGYVDAKGAEARFRMPMGLAHDPVTGGFLVADTFNHRIRLIERGSWEVRTVAGAGAGDRDGPLATARFTYPTAVTVAPDGTIYVTASGNGKVLRIDREAGRVDTLAGGIVGYRDGSGTESRLAPQGGLAYGDGILYLAEPANYRIRRIVPGVDPATTQVRTYAGTGRFGNADGPGDRAELPLPVGLARSSDGALYVSDGNGSIRVIR